MDGAISRRERIQAYFDGFRQGDHEKILALLTDDVEWDIHGHRRLRGKEAFDDEIENDAFEGRPKLSIDRIIEEGDTVAVPHTGEARRSDGGPFRFTGVTVFTFEDDLISRVESWVVPVSAENPRPGDTP